MAHNYIKSKKELIAIPNVKRKGGFHYFVYFCPHCKKRHWHPHGPYNKKIPIEKPVTASCGGRVFLFDIDGNGSFKPSGFAERPDA